MMWTDDPVRDQLRHDDEQEEHVCLRCVVCDAPLYEGDPYFDIEDDIFCPECMNKTFRRFV